jgi:hypothetical protein
MLKDPKGIYDAYDTSILVGNYKGVDIVFP